MCVCVLIVCSPVSGRLGSSFLSALLTYYQLCNFYSLHSLGFAIDKMVITTLVFARLFGWLLVTTAA